MNNVLPEAQSQEAEDNRKFENITYLIEKADEFYDSDRYDEAIKYYDMALAINKSDTYALDSIGDALYNLERYDEAIKYYDMALAINKSDTYALASIGDSLSSLGKNDEAIKYLDMALAIDANDTYAIETKATTLYLLASYDEAIKHYDMALALNNSNVYALDGKAVSLYVLDRYEEAIKYYDMALAIDKNDTYAMNGKGDSLFALGRYEEEIVQYDAMLDLDPENVETLYDKGTALNNLGRYSEAIQYFDKALTIDPTYTNAKEEREVSLARLSNLDRPVEQENGDKLNIDLDNSLVTLNFLFDNYLSLATVGIIIIALIVFFGGLRMVRPTHRAAIERLSRYHRFMKSGITWIIPIIDRIYPVNITEQMADADQQEIITKDNLNAFVDVQIYFKVKEGEESVKAALYNVNDYKLQIISLARTTLRNVIGNKEFSQVNNNRTQLNKEILESIQQQTANWGLEIVRCELKEIQPPADVQQTMNTVLKAQNEKQAAIDFATARETAADGEKRAAIKQAEGQMQSTVLKAEGEAQAILKVAEARSKEIEIINEAADKYFTGNAQILKQLEVSETAMKDNTKFVIAEKGTNPVIVFGQDGNPTNNVIVTKPKDKYPADVM